MADYSHLTARLTGPELNYDRPLTGPSIFGYRLGSDNPWQDEKNQRRLAKLVFGALGGGGLLSAGFKAQDLLDPHGWDRPFHKSEEAKEKEKQADIESRDDYPAIAKERKRLYAIAMRLNRPTDWARLRSFDKYA
jgi:hypothetical protein